ncbi:hypothetical protein ES319_A06G190900v1 [Gossypium barbadense]|uniref:Uncharacterized protein n=1 Tax=Gossypium barbadense TaxID=3634 RepID=A0A5J5VII4_GOSBA|nr:hypothetical protein ES319_A06G190900v1 [Gossypium barbadense]
MGCLFFWFLFLNGPGKMGLLHIYINQESNFYKTIIKDQSAPKIKANILNKLFLNCDNSTKLF